MDRKPQETNKSYQTEEPYREEKPYEAVIEREFSFLLEAGFIYEYLYDKGSDSSCVYIYRLKKGRDYLDFRSVSGGGEGNFVVFSNGQYIFPDLRLRHKKLFREFFWKHLLKKATVEERWQFAARLLREELSDGKLFGVSLLG